MLRVKLIPVIRNIPVQRLVTGVQLPACQSVFFFFSSRRRHTRWTGDWSSDVCSSDLGKTAAFAIPILQLIEPAMRKPQALIVVPTRELCVQVTREFGTLGKYMHSSEEIGRASCRERV